MVVYYQVQSTYCIYDQYSSMSANYSIKCVPPVPPPPISHPICHTPHLCVTHPISHPVSLPFLLHISYGSHFGLRRLLVSTLKPSATPRTSFSREIELGDEEAAHNLAVIRAPGGVSFSPGGLSSSPSPTSRHAQVTHGELLLLGGQDRAVSVRSLSCRHPLPDAPALSPARELFNGSHSGCREGRFSGPCNFDGRSVPDSRVT